MRSPLDGSISHRGSSFVAIPSSLLNNPSSSSAIVTEDLSPHQVRQMPDHMRLDNWPVPYPLSTVLTSTFTALCMVSYGQKDLEDAWKLAVEDGKAWTERMDRLGSRISAVNIIGGLLMGSTAAFITTTPPLAASLNYNERGPYICLLLSFGLTLGSLIVGSAMMYTLPMCAAKWWRESLMASRSHVCCTLIVASYPFISIGVATAVGALGLLVSGWGSQDEFIRKGCTSLLIIPASMIFLFLWTQIRPFKSS